MLYSFPCADLHGLRLPVIIGATPTPDSLHAFAKRLFADGLMDRTGPPRKGNVAATHMKKKKNLPALAAQEKITIVNLEDSAPRKKGKEKVLPPMLTGDTLSLFDSDEMQEVPPAAVKKRFLPDWKGHARAGAQPVVDLDELEDKGQDISLPSDSKFLPEKWKGKEDEGVGVGAGNADKEETSSNDILASNDEVGLVSRKRKAKVDGSNRPVKTQKCVIVEVLRLPSFRTDKGKAPERARNTWKRHSGASPASSEEEVSVYNFDIFHH